MADAITVDVGKAVGMFDRLAANADQLGPTVEASARTMLRTVSGVPVDTGELAGSLYVRRVGPTSALIVSKTAYAKYVFFGTKFVPARPPHFSYSPQQFAADVAREAFR